MQTILRIASLFYDGWHLNTHMLHMPTGPVMGI